MKYYYQGQLLSKENDTKISLRAIKDNRVIYGIVYLNSENKWTLKKHSIDMKNLKTYLNAFKRQYQIRYETYASQPLSLREWVKEQEEKNCKIYYGRYDLPLHIISNEEYQKYLDLCQERQDKLPLLEQILNTLQIVELKAR